MYTLGVSFDYHDSAAALMLGGKVIAAAQEERFTRKKHDASLPVEAMQYCITRAGIRAVDVNQVIHYEDPYDKLARILWASRQDTTQGRNYRDGALASWFSQGKLDVRRRLATHLGIPKSRIHTMNHHTAHAASAFFCSPFETATVVTLDGAGEFETASISLGEGTKLTRLQSVTLPFSLGLLYSALTAYLGFEVNEGEYKVMGMAGFGEPSHYDTLRQLVTFEEGGGFSVEQAPFNFLTPRESAFNEPLIDLLGPARTPESNFTIDPEHPNYKESKRYADVAASIQKLTEDMIIHVVTSAVKRTGIKQVCLAGGCALNSLANNRLASEHDVELFVQPAAGDSGSALGAALYGVHAMAGLPREYVMTHALLGPSFDDAMIEQAIDEAGLEPYKILADNDDICKTTAKLITEGNVIGWFQGCSEWGPRALGSRSILADPTNANIKSIVNEKIKFREPFRPFAPSVVAEKAADYFDIAGTPSPSGPENFMLQVCPVKEEVKTLMPAITHVDGTARVQTVRHDANPLYYRLIEEIGHINQVPVVLNTSFNLRGEPMVDKPADAIKTFSWSDMDYLIMGRYLLKKEWVI